MNDEIYPEIKDFLKKIDRVSVSLLQRRFNIGFNRASNIFEQLESDGLISKADGNKPREILKTNLSEKEDGEIV